MESIVSSIVGTSISVVIASKDRPDFVRETIEGLQRQTLKPREIIVVVPSIEDLPPKQWGDDVQYILGPVGLTAQRNKGISSIPITVPYVGYFDDDFELKPDYLEKAVAFMNANLGVVGISGLILKDGGVTREQAKRMIASYKPEGNGRSMFFSQGKHHLLYGCNMIIRRAVLNFEKFDENLPFYSYGEDYDLSIRLENYGAIGRFRGCIGVHLVAPSGRIREELRGYSLVANNFYFIKKGVVHLSPLGTWIRFWVICFGKSAFTSLCNLLRGDRTLDWRGRLKGQLWALRDIVLGCCHPARIKEM
jgi:GT2 family glycosyltransferase